MTEDEIGHHKWLYPDDPQLILIEGAPGVGKTTFSEQFCYKWSQGQRLKERTLLVLLPLRNNRVKLAKSVSDLFPHPHFKLQQAIAQEVESTHGEGVALLLEGWDELDEEKREKASIFLDLVHRRALPLATVIVTSRPWASKIIAERLVRQPNSQYIEIITTPTLEFSRVLREKKVDCSNRSKFIDYVMSKPFIKAVMHTPVTANMVVEVFQWSLDIDSPLPTTMTQLYTSYTCMLLAQHFSSVETHRQQSLKIQSLEDLPSDVQQQLQTISLVAWEGILKQQLIFSGRVVKETLGLMEAAEELYSEEDHQASCHFTHQMLQEFLAAYYISQLPKDQQQKIINQCMPFSHFNDVIKFYFGITRNSAFASLMILRHQKAYTLFGVYRKNACLYSWMYEINDRKFIREVLGPDKSVRVHSTYKWSPLEYYSVGYAIINSLCKWELVFFSSSMGDEEMEMWCEGVMDHHKEDARSEQEVRADFSRNTLTAESLKWFIKVPDYLLQRIVSLNFSSNKLDRKALNFLSQVIPSLSRLEVLHLSYNPIGKGEAVELMRALSDYKTPLKKLELKGMPLGEEDIQVLCEVLADDHMEELAIDGSTISIMGHHAETIRVKNLHVSPPMSVNDCTSLASLLKHQSCQLKELDIFHCKIKSDGAVQLAAALSKNKSVVKVNMGLNRDIEDVGAEAFGNMLRENTVLQELDLSMCVVTSLGCNQLAEGVRANSTLQVLNLNDNPITEIGVNWLLSSLRCNTTLTRLILPRTYYETPADPRVEWKGEDSVFTVLLWPLVLEVNIYCINLLRI